MTQLKASELLAQRIIQNHLNPLAIKQADFNKGDSVHDFDIVYRDGTVAALEVTADRSGAEAQWAHINNPVLEVPGCQNGWMVEMGAPPDKPRKWAQGILAPFLVELEKLGVLKATIYPDSPFLMKLPVELASLGVVAVTVYSTVDAGHSRLIIAGWSKPNTEYLAEWIGDFATSPRCSGERYKLAKSGFSQRHLAVFIPFLPASIPSLAHSIRSSILDHLYAFLFSHPK